MTCATCTGPILTSPIPDHPILSTHLQFSLLISSIHRSSSWTLTNPQIYHNNHISNIIFPYYYSYCVPPLSGHVSFYAHILSISLTSRFCHPPLVSDRSVEPILYNKVDDVLKQHLHRVVLGYLVILSCVILPNGVVCCWFFGNIRCEVPCIRERLYL